jgi:hypothetical protein
VTDHFEPGSVEVPGSLGNGDVVEPTGEMGFRLVKRAKLATDWGMSRRTPYLGATMFEVV